MNHLCIPFNFLELADEPREDADRRIALMLRLWMFWARDGRATRPFCNVNSTIYTSPPDELVLSLERAVQWDGTPAAFVAWCIVQGILSESPEGLTLTGFAELNPHLAPGWLPIQARGGKAKAARRLLRQLEKDAAAMHDGLLKSPELLFPSGAEATPAERKRCIALVMSLDAVSGRAVRAAAEYEHCREALADALHVVRTFPGDIAPVQQYLLANRDKAHITRDSAFVLAHFADYIRRSKET